MNRYGAGMAQYVPPGWLEGVQPPGADEWEATAVAWLLDLAPEYPAVRQAGSQSSRQMILTLCMVARLPPGLPGPTTFLSTCSLITVHRPAVSAASHAARTSPLATSP